MNYFWGNVLDYLKDRRYAAVFFGTLMAMGGLLIAGLIAYQVICAYELQGYLVSFLLAGVLISLIEIGRRIARARAQRREWHKISPLSRDELSKARSKLVKKQNH
jgi:hypothetical protein